jgi:hypothetical protein
MRSILSLDLTGAALCHSAALCHCSVPDRSAYSFECFVDVLACSPSTIEMFETNYGRDAGWLVERNGRCVAVLTDVLGQVPCGEIPKISRPVSSAKSAG